MPVVPDLAFPEVRKHFTYNTSTYYAESCDSIALDLQQPSISEVPLTPVFWAVVVCGGSLVHSVATLASFESAHYTIVASSPISFSVLRPFT